MKNVILLTSNQYAVPLIDRLCTNSLTVTVFIEEAYKPLITYFQPLFPAVSFKPYTEQGVLANITANTQLVVFGFSTKIPRVIYGQAALAVNIHFGKLPQEQGPDPLFWQLKAGTHNATITLHLLDEVRDQGPIVATQEIPLIPHETYGLTLTRLAHATPNILLSVLTDRITPNPQNMATSRYLPAPQLQDLYIDWAFMRAQEIAQLVLAANPRYGGAITTLAGEMIRVWEVSLVALPPDAQTAPGQRVLTNSDELVIQSKDGLGVQLNVIAIQDGVMSGRRWLALQEHPVTKTHKKGMSIQP